MWQAGSSSQMGNQTPALGVWSLNHWTAREIPAGVGGIFFFLTIKKKNVLKNRLSLASVALGINSRPRTP